MKIKKITTQNLSSNELRKINGGGAVGRVIGWIGGIIRKSAEIELEINGYIDHTRK